MKTPKTNIVVKDNKLIEASYRLTLVEQRIILASIVLARETQTGLGEGYVTIEAKWFAKTFSMGEKDIYRQLKEAIETLFTRFLVIHDIDPETGHKRVSKLRWISKASYIDQAGCIQFCFAQDLVPLITRLDKNFTPYLLEKIAGMTSPYAIRLYEMLMQWGLKGSREIEITWLKTKLVLDDDYDRLFDLKKRVIDVAVAQINQHSDLTCSYTQRKTGRTVTHLTFEFAPKVVEAQPKPVKKAPKRPTKPSDDETGRTKALRDYARTKAMLDAMNGTH